MTFENLGLAILADCEEAKSSKDNHQAMLVRLLKQPSFIPEGHDFESFVMICMTKKSTLMLKTFLSSF